MKSLSPIWLEFYIHAKALVSVLNRKTMAEIRAFFLLSFPYKDSERQHQMYLINFAANKLQN